MRRTSFRSSLAVQLFLCLYIMKTCDWYKWSAAEKIFFENSLRQYSVSSIIYVWNSQMHTNWEPLLHVWSWGEFRQFLRIAFLDFHRFFRHFLIVWGVFCYASGSLYINIAKNEQTPVKLSISNSFLFGEKSGFQR